MDGVMADSTQQYIDWYAARYGVKVEKATLLGKPETTGFPLEGVVRQFLYTPGFFRTKPVIEGAQEVIKALQDKHEVYIVSAAMEFPQSLSEKLAWLEEYFPFISWHNIVFCGYKNIVDADYMIDDHVKNLKGFKGKPYIFTAAHNLEVTGYDRINNWKEAAEIFLK